MSETKAAKLGIGAEHGIRLTSKSTTSFDLLQTKYSLGFFKGVLSIDILKSTFSEWKDEKYPWMQQFCQENDVFTLQKHKNPKQSIDCIGNMRRLYTESDTCLLTENFKCFIIHGIKIINTLLNLDFKLKKDTEAMENIARNHHIAL